MQSLKSCSRLGGYWNGSTETIRLLPDRRQSETSDRAHLVLGNLARLCALPVQQGGQEASPAGVAIRILFKKVEESQSRDERHRTACRQISTSGAHQQGTLILVTMLRVLALAPGEKAQGIVPV